MNHDLHDLLVQRQTAASRRYFLQSAGYGLGMAALSQLLAADGASAAPADAKEWEGVPDKLKLLER